jgi:polysaccharide export outer membrane protein
MIILRNTADRDGGKDWMPIILPIIFLCLFFLSGCASTPLTYHGPEKPPSQADKQQQGVNEFILQARLNSEAGRAPLPGIRMPAPRELPLSPGDRLRILVNEGEPFSGIFEVDLDGNLHIPYLKPIRAEGETVSAVEGSLARALVEEKIFRSGFVQASVRILQWAPIRVSVAGAVFAPGRVLTNDRLVEVKAHQITQITGDYPTERFLTATLRRAGGVRPDADVRRIKLIRNGVTSVYDLSGVFSGTPVQDVPLVAGDQVIVASVGHFQDELMRPSQVTAPGFNIFISNLTTPAETNALSAINKDARSIPYGTRLLRGLMAANCVGGIQATNASRVAVLVTTDRTTGEISAIERQVNDLIRQADDTGMNPYLMPNDGIACYDSGITSVRDVAKLVSLLMAPVFILHNILD